MSKASDYAALVAAKGVEMSDIEAQRPEGWTGDGMAAIVSNDGTGHLSMGGQKYSVSESSLVLLSAWIVKNFGA